MMPIASKISISLLMLTALVCGCAVVGDKYQRPETRVPATWQGGSGNSAAWPDKQWWQGFRSDELDRLIAEAQAGSHDLKAAAARVAQARALARIAGAPLLPSLTVGAEASRGNSTSISNPKNSGNGTFNTFRVAPQVSYEIDLWGANRMAGEAANDNVLASVYGQEVVRLALTADVANTYFQILALKDLLDDAQRNLEIARKAQNLVDAQKTAGRLSAFDVERQRSQVATAEAAIPPLQQQLQAAHDALAVLLGKPPGEVTIVAASLRDIVLPDVPLGLPATLLERRPDIRQAEMNLMTANANVGVARAALFPTLNLNAVAGSAAGTFGGMFKSRNGFDVISLGMVATIFDGGRLKGQVELASARKLELIESYQQSIISGFRDVEDALTGVRQFAVEENAQREAVTHAREVNRIADLLLRSGAREYTAVLDAQRTLLAAETAADGARLRRFSSVVGLYRALGGGWDMQLPQSTDPPGKAAVAP